MSGNALTAAVAARSANERWASSRSEATLKSGGKSAPDFSALRVAIVHDWLITYAGSERVLEQLLALFPHAVMFTLMDFLSEKERGFLDGHEVRTSFLQHFPFARTRYRRLLPLMPLAVEQLDVSGFDLVISSSHAVAKGVITGPDQLHLCYCHSPIRYAWDLQHQYLRESKLTSGPKSWLARWLLHRIRMWDSRTANGVDEFVANSDFVARRLNKVYRRPATVIHPPVDSETFTVRSQKEDFYLAASRMVPYKRVPLIVEAFAKMPDKRLVVIGDGPELPRVQELATANVSVLGYRETDELRDHMQRAKAFVFAAQEDFGIMPVEAQACGTPVVAYSSGGAAETVVDGKTGIHFHEQTADAIVQAVQRLDEAELCPLRIRANAERFSAQRFRTRIADFVSELARRRSLPGTA